MTKYCLLNFELLDRIRNASTSNNFYIPYKELSSEEIKILKSCQLKFLEFTSSDKIRERIKLISAAVLGDRFYEKSIPKEWKNKWAKFSADKKTKKYIFANRAGVMTCTTGRIV